MRVPHTLILLLAVMGLPAAAGGAPARKRPNVLFLFTDDQRSDTIRALGNRHIHTPNLDRLVRSGFTFRNAYCLGSYLAAVCTPSRQMLLSGNAYFRGVPLPQYPSLPRSLQSAGYFTYHHGKRGNTVPPIQALFDVNLYVNERDERASGQPGKAIADQAIEFLRGYREPRPFFMYLAFEAPHDPRVAAPEFLRRYDPARIPLPANYMPVHPFDNGEMTVRDEWLAPWPRPRDEVRRHLRDYYAVITGLDFHIGRILRALRQSGRARDTIVVFSSDHGLAIGSHGLMGKQNLYEHSVKAPLVLTGPGIPHGSSDALVYLLDLYPTFCDIGGAPVPPGLDGRSLLPIIRGRERRVRESLFLAYRDNQRAVRWDRWKLIRYAHLHRSQLFDLKRDPHERNDLSDDPAQRARVWQMTELLREWQRSLGDMSPIANRIRRSGAFFPPRWPPRRASWRPRWPPPWRPVARFRGPGRPFAGTGYRAGTAERVALTRLL